GAPSLDNLESIDLFSQAELESRFGVDLSSPLLLVTYHPVTLEYQQAEWQIRELLSALDSLQMSVLFTLPNADTNTRVISHAIEDYVATHPWARKVDNLGTGNYFSFMAVAAAMVGNSSSGIIEAASFRLPVVNIGSRQLGRAR